MGWHRVRHRWSDLAAAAAEGIRFISHISRHSGVLGNSSITGKASIFTGLTLFLRLRSHYSEGAQMQRKPRSGEPWVRWVGQWKGDCVSSLRRTAGPQFHVIASGQKCQSSVSWFSDFFKEKTKKQLGPQREISQVSKAERKSIIICLKTQLTSLGLSTNTKPLEGIPGTTGLT